MEAEYRALTKGAKECTWLWRLYEEIKILNSEPIVIFCNNQSIMKIVRNLVFHAHMKHIEVHYHYIREKLENEKVGSYSIPKSPYWCHDPWTLRCLIKCEI
jgi:hypothetical protein